MQSFLEHPVDDFSDGLVVLDSPGIPDFDNFSGEKPGQRIFGFGDQESFLDIGFWPRGRSGRLLGESAQGAVPQPEPDARGTAYLQEIAPVQILMQHQRTVSAHFILLSPFTLFIHQGLCKRKKPQQLSDETTPGA
jgi:hypothetical protein